MAIVQISRITNRKGLEVDLPQPLAGAELGWAIDERKLYIGNGELAEGAPVVGNTEILTEFSDILGFATSYTYRGEAGGYVVQTGPTPGDPVSQSIQSRLDSYAVVTDFGAVGDGVTDNTAAINRALYQLYCVDNNPAVRRSLFFPAGVYLVTGPILIPSYATLYGDGINGSIIALNVFAWNAAISYQPGILVSYSGLYYRSQVVVPVDADIHNTIYWAEEAEPYCIAQTADSHQNVGVNIGTNSAVPPTGISITNMGFQTNLEIDGFLYEDATSCVLNSVSVQGPFTQTIINNYSNVTTVNAGDFVVGDTYKITFLGNTDWNDVAGTTGVTYSVGDTLIALNVGSGTGIADFVPPQISAVAWSSTLAVPCKHITINNCQFNGFWYGSGTDQEIKGITFSNNYFDTLYQGVYLGGAAPVNGGATGVKILHNVFDNIFYQGVLFEGVHLNSTGYNMFYDVGNEFNGVDYPITAVVEFESNNNVSVGDMFERTDAIVADTGITRISINNLPSIATTNGSQIELGTYARRSGVSATLIDNTVSPLAVTSVDATINRAFKFDYTVVRNYANVRTGTLTVVASTDGTGSNLVYDDTGVQNSDTGVTLSAVESGDVITILYTTTNTGEDATLNYSISTLA